jgi:hypothetical protein
VANELIDALKSADLGRVRAAIKSDPAGARKPQAICTAAGQAFLPAIETLARYGADLNGVRRGYRPLHSLIQTDPHESATTAPKDRLRCLEWLLAHGADPELPGAWPPARAVITAAVWETPEYVTRLHRKADAFAATALADRKLVETTLRNDPDFARGRDVGGLTALQCAAGSRMPGRYVEILRLLLDAGADLRAKTKSWSHEIDAVYLAASVKSADRFQLLLERGADATEALSPALWNDNEELAAMALSHGAIPDGATADGQPLLNNLVRWGAFRQALWLLEHGASPNLADERGWTAVRQAASRGNERILKAIMEAGGDPSRRDKEGCAPQDRVTRKPIIEMLAR